MWLDIEERESYVKVFGRQDSCMVRARDGRVIEDKRPLTLGRCIVGMDKGDTDGSCSLYHSFKSHQKLLGVEGVTGQW